MRAAWTVSCTPVVCDHSARSTVENAANVTATAAALGAAELIVVTSRWHRLRTRVLFRAALRGQQLHLSVEGADGPRPAAAVARELVCLALLPFQLLRLRNAVPRGTSRLDDGRVSRRRGRELPGAAPPP
jgi:uncharacterized SAM-binding protein YcdF (DUF218 family)